MAAPPKPWKTEYAKSNRSTCKTCSSVISKDTLRIAKVVPASMFDGFMTVWHHAKCLLKKNAQIRSLDDVEGIDSLRWEDQQKIRKHIEGGSIAEDGGSTKRAKSVADDVDGEYAMEVAKSSRATCKSCNEKIQKDEVRISTMVETEGAKFRGKVPAWRHSKCFLELGWWTRPIQEMDGWKDLSNEDKKAIKELAKPYVEGSQEASASKEKISKKIVSETSGTVVEPKKISKKTVSETSGTAVEPKKISKKIVSETSGTAVEPNNRKRKKTVKGETEDEVEKEASKVENKKSRTAEKKLEPCQSKDNELEKKLERQSRALWDIKDNLKKYVDTAELRLMLEVNGQDSSGSEYDLKERCADGMLFGALEKCTLCGGPLEYHDGQYRCKGNLSEWTKCTLTTTTPKRVKGKWKIPEDTDNDYLKKWFKLQSAKKEARLLPPPSSKPASKGENATKKILAKGNSKGSNSLEGLLVLIVGRLKTPLLKWKESIQTAGGKVLKDITSDTLCVVTSESELENENSKAKLYHALSLKVPIVREDFLSDCLERGTLLPVSKYILETGEKLSSIMKVRVKGRSAVHEDTGLQETGHILEDGKTIYNTTLNLSDLSTGINSFYVMQIIEDDKKNVYHLFRKWGRVGNNKIGSFKLERCSKSAAVSEFKRLFQEKTGNDWESWVNKSGFRKTPNKFYPLDIDYGVDDKPPRDIQLMGSKSKLEPRLIALMKMLFDLETYKAAMLEFEINISEMPLGKLSNRNIEQGFQVLTEIQDLLKSENSCKGLASKDISLIDASNRFFTLIPHVHPQVINGEDVLKLKIQMLEELRNIEIASKLIGTTGEDTDEDALDINYKKLHCDISPLPHDCSDFQMVKVYLERTHAPTHTDWSLELEDVFVVDREGEHDAYVPYKQKMSNCMLLWHGSRTTNFVGILSQGMRIAPPEAPVTGYMFGKGVYFADMVSKSAQYCYTTKQNPVGLMLLSEVALGNIHELKQAKYMEKPPAGKDSTKGLGKTKPLESEYQTWGEDVVVPCGSPTPAGVKNTSLMYNEYIVYNTSQMKLRFLLKVRFKHKR